MTLRVACPFCNTGFDVAGTPQRVSCPRCGEAVPVKPADDSGLPSPSINGDGAYLDASCTEAPPAPSGLKPLALIAAALFTAVAVGIGVWLAGFLTPKEKPPEVVKTNTPRPTWPPQTLSGLRYLPTDSQLVFAIQPSPLLQYAERTKQDPNRVMADGGLPKQIFDWLSDAGIQPDQIDHVAVGVKLDGIPPFAVLLSLREPLANEGQFYKGLKAKRDVDKNLYRVPVGSLAVTVGLVKVDDTKYLFASRDEDLDLAKKPHEGVGQFRKGLQESIQKLGPASFFWLATDTQDWKANASLSLLASVGMKQGDLWKTFDPKLRATAVGLALDGEPKVTAAVRYDDNATMAQRVKGWAEKVKEAQGETFGEGEWAGATVPLNPTEACGKVLKLIYTP